MQCTILHLHDLLVLYGLRKGNHIFVSQYIEVPVWSMRSRVLFYRFSQEGLHIIHVATWIKQKECPDIHLVNFPMKNGNSWCAHFSLSDLTFKMFTKFVKSVIWTRMWPRENSRVKLFYDNCNQSYTNTTRYFYHCIVLHNSLKLNSYILKVVGNLRYVHWVWNDTRTLLVPWNINVMKQKWTKYFVQLDQRKRVCLNFDLIFQSFW